MATDRRLEPVNDLTSWGRQVCALPAAPFSHKALRARKRDVVLTAVTPLRDAAVEDGTACGYYRVRLPFDEMVKHGHDMKYARHYSEFDESWPVLVAERVGHPGFALDWLRLWRKHRLIWETDD